MVYVLPRDVIEDLGDILKVASPTAVRVADVNSAERVRRFVQYRCTEPMAWMVQRDGSEIMILVDLGSGRGSLNLAGVAGCYTFILSDQTSVGGELRGNVERMLFAAGMMGRPRSFRYLFGGLSVGRLGQSLTRSELSVCPSVPSDMSREVRVEIADGKRHHAEAYVGPEWRRSGSINATCYLALHLPLRAALCRGTRLFVDKVEQLAASAGGREVRPARSWRHRWGVFDRMVGSRR